MLFHEIYGSYFQVVSAILSEAARHSLDTSRIHALIQEKAFAESGLTIPAALREGWPLLREDLSTPIRHAPSMPPTALEKRWLKTLLQDPRIGLFSPDPAGLEDVEPLFDWEDVVCFDQYADGDPYSDKQYIEQFHTLLTALHERRKVKINYRGASGRRQTVVCVPQNMEYSQKDDKFRVIVSGNRAARTFNISRIEACELLEPVEQGSASPRKSRQRLLTFRLKDERDALNRALLHFSDLEKETVKLNDTEYEVTLKYDCEDEAELLIRILSFGPLVKVTAPEYFIRLIRARLKKQSLPGGQGQ